MSNGQPSFKPRLPKTSEVGAVSNRCDADGPCIAQVESVKSESNT